MQEIFFCLSGKIAYVLPRFNNAQYYYVVKGDIFGLEDVIYNIQIQNLEPDMKVLS